MLARLIGALALQRLIAIAFQFLVFLRTDLYAVLVVGLDCVQLTRTTRLTITRAIGRLTRHQPGESAAADPHDLKVARWYRWLYLAGMLWAAWFLAAFAIPWLTTITRWTFTSLAHTSPSRPRFWESLLFGVLVLGPLLLPALMIIQERLHDHNT